MNFRREGEKRRMCCCEETYQKKLFPQPTQNNSHPPPCLSRTDHTCLAASPPVPRPSEPSAWPARAGRQPPLAASSLAPISRTHARSRYHGDTKEQAGSPLLAHEATARRRCRAFLASIPHPAHSPYGRTSRSRRALPPFDQGRRGNERACTVQTAWEV